MDLFIVIYNQKPIWSVGSSSWALSITSRERLLAQPYQKRAGQQCLCHVVPWILLNCASMCTVSNLLHVHQCTPVAALPTFHQRTCIIWWLCLSPDDRSSSSSQWTLCYLCQAGSEWPSALCYSLHAPLIVFVCLGPRPCHGAQARAGAQQLWHSDWASCWSYVCLLICSGTAEVAACRKLGSAQCQLKSSGWWAEV